MLLLKKTTDSYRIPVPLVVYSASSCFTSLTFTMLRNAPVFADLRCISAMPCTAQSPFQNTRVMQPAPVQA